MADVLCVLRFGGSGGVDIHMHWCEEENCWWMIFAAQKQGMTTRLFFLSWRTKRKAVKMLQRGEIDVLGSDCHNMTTRPPRLGEAIQVIQKSVEPDVWREFQRNLPDLLQDIK